MTKTEVALKFARAFLRGMGSVIVIYRGAGSVSSRSGDTWEEIASDWKSVGDDIRGVMSNLEVLPEGQWIYRGEESEEWEAMGSGQ